MGVGEKSSDPHSPQPKKTELMNFVAPHNMYETNNANESNTHFEEVPYLLITFYHCRDLNKQIPIINNLIFCTSQ